MAANKTLKFNNTIKSFSSTNDQISNTKEKIYYCMRTIALLLLFLTFAFTAFMVIYIPPLDAN
ncbi:hypothetical protein FACS189459_0290 [Bacilli bacterium]|nr:hypothetical protein FACS189459_0290 [Bacilli bacterium]